MKFTARLPVCYYFTVRPFAEYGWTDGGTNEEAENQVYRRTIGPSKKRFLPLSLIYMKMTEK